NPTTHSKRTLTTYRSSRRRSCTPALPKLWRRCSSPWTLSALVSRTSLRPFGVTIPTISVTRPCLHCCQRGPSQV
ncbi:hypothetical protein CPB97_003219, partial [Podila verticillata]